MARLIVRTSCSPAKAGVQEPKAFSSHRAEPGSAGPWAPAFAGERSRLIGLASRRRPLGVSK